MGKRHLNFIWSSIKAGALIAIGGTIYLNCGKDYVGALLFAVALCGICNLNLSLFTGKVCFARSSRDVLDLVLCIIGNAIGCFVFGKMIAHALPYIQILATLSCESKLNYLPVDTLIRSVLCGVLMSVAVQTFKYHDGFSKYTGILTCIPTFVLCGFEHSIADMAYFSMSMIQLSPNMLGFISCTVIGNAIGGLLFSNIIGGKQCR